MNEITDISSTVRIDSLVNVEPNPSGVPMSRPLLRVGALLEAIAVRDVTSGQLYLQLANQQRLPARLASGAYPGPAEGEVLKLRVLRDSPVLVFESIHDDFPRQPQPEDALRRVLPQQTQPTLLLANIGWLMRRPSELAQLPPVVQRSLQQLWQSLPDAEHLVRAEHLQEALLHSGTFLESELAQAQGAPATQQAILQADYKSALLALRARLKTLNIGTAPRPTMSGPLPSLSGHIQALALGPASLAALDTSSEQLAELKQLVEGSIARIQTNQLLADQAAQQGTPAWLIELPIRHDQQTELLRFKFEKDARASTEQAAAWQVEVAVDLGALGTLHAELHWHSAQGLNVKLRSDSAPLVAAINEQLDVLSAALQAQGVPLRRVMCLHGLPIDGAAGRLNKLLDLHA